MEGVKKNYESTAQVLKHNCETHGHGESCYKLGAYHVTGKGTPLTLLFVDAHLFNTIIGGSFLLQQNEIVKHTD